MTWAIVLEALLVMAIYLVVDRAAFWFVTNTFAQISGRLSSASYLQIAFPRLLVGFAGCALTVAGKEGHSTVASVIGLFAMLTSLAALIFYVVKENWDNSNS